MKLRVLVKRIVYIGLISTIACIALLSFLLCTKPGLYTVVKLSRFYLPGTLSVQKLNGRLLDHFSIGTLKYTFKGKDIICKNVNLNWHFLSLINKELPIYNLSAKSIRINHFNPFKTIKNFKANGNLSKQEIHLNLLEFNYLFIHSTGQLKITPSYPYSLEGKVKLTSKYKRLIKSTGTIQLNGNIDDMQWNGKLSGPFEISLNGSLSRLSEFKQIIKWANLIWDENPNTSIHSPNGRIEIRGELPNLFIQLQSKIGYNSEKNWQLASTIEGKFPWTWSFDVNLLQALESSKHEGLYTKFALKGSILDYNKGNFSLTINPGHYQLPSNQSIPFSGSTIQFTLDQKQLFGAGKLTIDSNKLFNFSFALPQFHLNKDLSKQALIADASVEFNSIDFLQQLSPYLQNLKGKLLAQLSARGTLLKPNLEGTLALSHGSMNINLLGLELNPIELKFSSNHGEWNANGFIESSGKKLTILGKGPITSNIQGTFTLEGDHFKIANTKEYQIQISPKLQFTLKPNQIHIDGTTLVPEAHINLHRFTNSLSASEDIIFVKKDRPSPTPLLNTSMNVQITMGDTVELTYKGLHALLNGAVLVNQLPLGPVTGKGVLNVTKGEYKAYAQDLTIEQGQLLFNGGRLDNPGINLRASKLIINRFSNLNNSSGFFDLNLENNNNFGEKIVAGVEVSGPLQSPKIQLFSNPPSLSQADILSMLVLGRPASQANKAGGQLLLAAISSMNLGSGSNGAELVEQLKQKLGFDINVQTTSNYNQSTNQITDTTGVVVGKSISDRVYVSYNVGLSQADPNILTLKYLLNKFLSIQITSSDSGNGADVVYTSVK